MSDSFDPYSEWLGIASGERPLHYYLLLGLKFLESDPETIGRAADAAMARLRRIRPGAQLAEWSRLLDQLKAAKLCLLDPASKAAYDRSLAGPAPRQQPVLATPPTVVARPRESVARPQENIRPAAVEERPRSPFLMGYVRPPTYAAPGAVATPPPSPTPSSHSSLLKKGTGSELSGDGAVKDNVREVPVPFIQQAAMEPLATTPMPANHFSASIPTAFESPPHYEPPVVTPMTFEPVPTALPFDAEMVDATPIVRRSSPATGAAHASSWTGPLVAGLLVMVVGLCGIVAAMLHQQGKLPFFSSAPEAVARSATPAASAPLPPGPSAVRAAAPSAKPQPAPPATPLRRAKLGPLASPAADPMLEVAQNPTPDAEPPAGQGNPNAVAGQGKPAVDAQKSAAFAEAVAAVRSAMSARDLATARKHLNAAVANTQTPEDNGQVDRLATMIDNLTEFWKGICVTFSRLQPTEEIMMKNEPIVVVESGRDYLTVRSAGRVQRYEVRNIPTTLVLVLVKQSFGKDAGSKAIVGTFLAVDPGGDRALAKQYWQEAAKAGIDTAKLLHELDGTAAAGPAGGGPRLEPPTDKAKLQAAEQAVRQEFKKNYDDATSLVKKAELARELLLRAPGTANADARFVMFREARDMAVAAGQPLLACEVVDQLARCFAVEPLQLKAAALEEISKSARGTNSQREIVQAALTLVQQAYDESRLDEAGRLASLAVEAARKSKNVTLMRQTSAANQQIQAERKQGGKK